MNKKVKYFYKTKKEKGGISFIQIYIFLIVTIIILLKYIKSTIFDSKISSLL